MRLAALAPAAVLALVPLAAVAEPAVNARPGDRLAIHGADPVAYFDGARRDGRPDLEATHAGAVWRFASAENRSRFLADPERYLPQYGGFCAYGTARGYLVDIDPDAWTVREGKLYLNYSLEVQDTWRADPAPFVAAADAHWPGLRDAPAAPPAPKETPR